MLEEMSISSRDFKAWNTIPLKTHQKAIFTGYDFSKLKMDNVWIKCLSDHFRVYKKIVNCWFESTILGGFCTFECTKLTLWIF